MAEWIESRLFPFTGLEVLPKASFLFKSLLGYISMKVKVKSLSRVLRFATLWTVAYQAPPSMGFSRQECWSGLPFPSPGDLPDPGMEPGSPALRADALSSEPPGKPTFQWGICQKSSHWDKGYFLYILQPIGNNCIFRIIAICFINISDIHIPLIVQYPFWWSRVSSLWVFKLLLVTVKTPCGLEGYATFQSCP